MRCWLAIAILALWGTCLLGPGFSSAQDDHADVRKVVTRVLPVYPAVARTMGIRGNVRVDVVVSPNGTVKSLEVKGGHPVLAEAAADAVRKWRWVPAAHETKEPVTLKFDPSE